MTTAHELSRRLVSWPCEVRRGEVSRMSATARQGQRVAERMARVLTPIAESVGAWVSTEALIRVERDPDTALRPAVAVVEGSLPYDGVVDEGLLLVVESDVRRLELWRSSGVSTIWIPRSGGVVVAVRHTTKVVAPSQRLVLPGRAKASMAAGELCRLVGTCDDQAAG